MKFSKFELSLEYGCVYELCCKKVMKQKVVRNEIRTHAHICGPDLESGALDRSATLTTHCLAFNEIL